MQVLYNHLPEHLVKECIFPYLTVYERHGLSKKFIYKLVKELQYARDEKKYAIRPISYYNRINLEQYSQNVITIRSKYFESKIKLYRSNFNDEQRFYVENRITLKTPIEHINMFDKCQLRLSVKRYGNWIKLETKDCFTFPIGYNNNTEKQIGSKQLVQIFYNESKCLEYNLMHI